MSDMSRSLPKTSNGINESQISDSLFVHRVDGVLGFWGFGRVG